MKHILALLLTACAITASGQALTPIDTNSVTTAPAQALSTVIRFDENAQAATNWVFSLSPLYAPNLRDRSGTLRHWGGGVSALYPASQYAYVGFSVDYIGDDFFVGSVGATLKVDLKLFSKIRLTPLITTKVSYVLSDDGKLGGEPIGVAWTGFTTTFWRSENGKISVGGLFVIEKWSNFDGPVYRPGITLNAKF